MAKAGRSRGPFQGLVAKEWRELWAARAWWLMLVMTGPLVGVSFINAMQMYAELSGYNGTSTGVGEAFSPLVGIWAPTFSAYELIAAFLFPFVVIRMFAGDRQSGALKLELQQRLRPWVRVAAKSLVLVGAWLVASVPMLIALVLWLRDGGHAYPPEILTVAAGHLLNACLTIAIGAMAASIAEHPATAAIIALGVTVGTWVISFLAALHGGAWERVATFTPPSMVAQFQHGLIRLDVLLSVLAIVVLGVLVGAVWMQLGQPVAQRAAMSAALVGVAGLVIAACTFARASWDTSENRQNSFPKTDEAALGAIAETLPPLTIAAYFAAEDGRRSELDRAFAKLRRAMPDVTIAYVARTSVGLYEQNTEHYGEIIYTLGAAQNVSRIVTAEGVLENIYAVAGVTPPVEDEREIFRGYPLAVPPRHAGSVFYAVWPAIIAGGWFRHRRTA